METESSEPSQSPQDESMLTKLRNTWEFSNLMQYIFIYGKAVKIDEDFDIEVRPPLSLNDYIHFPIRTEPVRYGH